MLPPRSFNYCRLIPPPQPSVAAGPTPAILSTTPQHGTSFVSAPTATVSPPARSKAIRANSLGDLRAEADRPMLRRVFVETPDYRTLIETSDRTIVVGRRGTGKSALALRLLDFWKDAPKVHVQTISPEDYQTLGLRPLASLFGERFNLIRSGMKIAWRYVFVMETTAALATNYRFANDESNRPLIQRLEDWHAADGGLFDRLTDTLKNNIDIAETPEARIGSLAVTLDIKRIEELLARAARTIDLVVVFLVDRLDEGYEPDDIGTGLVDGLIQGALETSTNIPSLRPYIFLRDNMFRAVRNADPDYSRNIEGSVLRLHWDEDNLWDFAARRMRRAFSLPHEATLKIWNHCTTGELRGRAGFREMLRLTLYRPRDLLSLLNETFRIANRASIALHDVDKAAKQISDDRLADLIKEYEAIVPSLRTILSTFEGHPPEWSEEELLERITSTMARAPTSSLVRQDLDIWGAARPVVDVLFSVGFLGIHDSISGRFIFRHDGRGANETGSIQRSLVHPCYWLALGCSEDLLSSTGDAEDIFDEYAIQVSSETPELRDKRIQGMIDELTNIPHGPEGATAFEIWCEKVIRTCFAKGLHNVERQPNAGATRRRDIVGTNQEEGKAWQRIYRDYGARQVVFEVKNYQELEVEDYTQLSSYLSGDYGRIGFLISRDDSIELKRGKDIDRVMDCYRDGEKLIIKLTARYLCGLLSKLKKPMRHDRVNDSLGKLLDTYVRLYLVGQSGKSARPRTKKRRRKRNRDGR